MTTVSELLALKIENLQLKLQALQASAQLTVTLQQQLIAEARTETGAPAEAIYNVETRSFVLPNGADRA